MRRSICWIFGIAAVSAVIADAGTARAQTEMERIVVLVFNYSRASDALIARAEVETSRVFSQAGIGLAWFQCPVNARPDSPVCHTEAASTQIRIRILDRNIAKVYQDGIFGFAIAPVFASVYYESAQRVARQTTESEANVATILGCLIAHEVGHLLLGHNQHTASGIMKASWDIQQIKLAMMGRLLFVPEQSKRMLENVHLRMSSGIKTARITRNGTPN